MWVIFNLILKQWQLSHLGSARNEDISFIVFVEIIGSSSALESVQNRNTFTLKHIFRLVCKGLLWLKLWLLELFYGLLGWRLFLFWLLLGKNFFVRTCLNLFQACIRLVNASHLFATLARRLFLPCLLIQFTLIICIQKSHPWKLWKDLYLI